VGCGGFVFGGGGGVGFGVGVAGGFVVVCGGTHCATSLILNQLKINKKIRAA